MNSIKLLLGSSVGRKFVMAVSGALLFCFVVGHMIGNLQFFLPPEAINRYAHFLQSTPELLWVVRLGLLATVLLHLWSASHLWAENRAARPVRYAMDPAVASSSYASRTMMMSGLIVATFLVFHLLHYTVRVEAVSGAEVAFRDLKDPATGHPDVYAMMVAGFSVWYVSVFYLAAVGLLCLHLSHGLNAAFQSLGLMSRPYRAWLERGAKVVALVLFLGYASIPASVLVFGHGREYFQEVRAKSVAVLQEVSE